MNDLTKEKILFSALWCLIVYFVAAIPFGVIVSRIVAGKDVRRQGSGNIGATNVARMMGKKWGILVLVLDALKGFLVVFLPIYFLTHSDLNRQGSAAQLYFFNVTAVIAVLAHCYPIYLKFKGGKGVATALGVIAALSPLNLGISFVVFALTLAIYRRVSGASLLAALALPVASVILKTPLLPSSAMLICAVVWWKHRENIKRIADGIEPRFF